MVCAALGEDRSETYWAGVLGSYNFGTPASRVTRLNTKGYRVAYGSTDLNTLSTKLQAGQYAIVFVSADQLPWADFTGFHALVLSDITSDEVFLHDPALPSGPNRLSHLECLLAWDAFDCIAAVIAR
jgi:predicted double-glycine peptidase